MPAGSASIYALGLAEVPHYQRHLLRGVGPRPFRQVGGAEGIVQWLAPRYPPPEVDARRGLVGIGKVHRRKLLFGVGFYCHNSVEC